MKIAALCPTYKRPDLLLSAVACFTRQELGDFEARLFVLDDANQLPRIEGPRYEVHSIAQRFANLPAKYEALIALAESWGADAYAIWEDDDIFLPWHLRQAAEAFESGRGYYHLPEAWTTYGVPRNRAQLEPAAGRFHSSWAFTRERYKMAGGYPRTAGLDFDQQFWRRLIASEGLRGPLEHHRPSYCYRWGNGQYHGSAAGSDGYASLWERLAALPSPRIDPGQFVPRLDPQAAAVIEYCQSHS